MVEVLNIIYFTVQHIACNTETIKSKFSDETFYYSRTLYIIENSSTRSFQKTFFKNRPSYINCTTCYLLSSSFKIIRRNFEVNICYKEKLCSFPLGWGHDLKKGIGNGGPKCRSMANNKDTTFRLYHVTLLGIETSSIHQNRWQSHKSLCLGKYLVN